MALQLSKEVESGFSGSYWRIVELKLEFKVLQATVSIFLYKDKQARIDEKREISSYEFNWKNVDYPFSVAAMDKLDDNPIKIAYNKIKTLDEWKTAIDV